MPETHEVVRDVPVNIGRVDSGSGDLLNVVAVRLLVVALRIMPHLKSSRICQIGLAIPNNYRNWPAVEVESGVGQARRWLRFYVSPKGAVTANNQAFPVGTELVMETDTWSDGDGKRLVSVFVMKKVASMYAYTENTAHQEGWAYALYDQRGPVFVKISASGGLCRLPHI